MDSYREPEISDELKNEVSKVNFESEKQAFQEIPESKKLPNLLEPCSSDDLHGETMSDKKLHTELKVRAKINKSGEVEEMKMTIEIQSELIKALRH